MLRSGYDRGNFLLTKHARVIAMTCTHAAIKRRDLLALGFQYDNLVIEEAAQIMEVETFIPMVLQAVDAAALRAALSFSGSARKRAIVAARSPSPSFTPVKKKLPPEPSLRNRIQHV